MRDISVGKARAAALTEILLQLGEVGLQGVCGSREAGTHLAHLVSGNKT